MAHFIGFFLEDKTNLQLSDRDVGALKRALSVYKGHFGDEIARVVQGTVLESRISSLNDVMTREREELPHLRRREKLEADLQRCLEGVRFSEERLRHYEKRVNDIFAKIKRDADEAWELHNLLLEHYSLCRSLGLAGGRKRALDEDLEPGEIVEQGSGEPKRMRSPAEESAVRGLLNLQHHSVTRVNPVC
jgi:hypothetical protein